MDVFIKQINKLIVQISKGKMKALDKLYKLTAQMLLVMAKKYLFDGSYAEDLLSETYLKVVRGAASFDKSKNGLNWIYTILHNGAMDYNRKNKNCITLPEDCQCYVDLEVDNIDDWLERIMMKDALSKLTDDEKRLIMMRYWQGYRIADIAVLLNKSTATAYDRINKALNKLRRYMR